LREAHDTNSYRVVYVVVLKTGCTSRFMKKPESGPKTDANLVQARLKRAQELDEEDDDG